MEICGSAFTSENEHRIAVAEEAISLSNRLVVGGADELETCQALTRTSKLLRGRWKFVMSASSPRKTCPGWMKMLVSPEMDSRDCRRRSFQPTGRGCADRHDPPAVSPPQVEDANCIGR